MTPPGVDPFAPPRADVDAAQPPVQGGPFFARPVGKDLMIQKEAALPPLCVKCARTDGLTTRDQKFQWVPPWVFVFCIFGLIGILVAVILQLVLRKAGRLLLPICPECNARWKSGQVAIGGGVVAFIGILVGGIFLLASLRHDFPLFLVCLVVAIGVLLAVQLGFARPRMLFARKVDNATITVAGLHPETARRILEAATPR